MNTLAPSLNQTTFPSFVADVEGNPVKVELLAITPMMAASFLTHNTHNRNLRGATVTAYATDMANGDWRFTGAPVTFAADGRLLDGQHRLQGIIESASTQLTLVVRGLEPEAQEETDGGIPRKFADALSLRGETNCSLLAATVRRVAGWEQGARRNPHSFKASTPQLLRVLEAHPEIRDFISPGSKVANGCDLPASMIATAWWLFSQIDEDTGDADVFFSRLGDGQNLLKGDPIFELRRTVQSTKDVRGERSQTYLMAVLIKAWNAYRRGDTVGLLKWRAGGANPEAFPEPI